MPAHGALGKPVAVFHAVFRHVARPAVNVRIIIAYHHGLFSLVIPLVGLDGIIPAYIPFYCLAFARGKRKMRRNCRMVPVAGRVVRAVFKARLSGKIAPIHLEIVKPVAAVPIFLIRNVVPIGAQRHLSEIGAVAVFALSCHEHSRNSVRTEIFVGRTGIHIAQRARHRKIERFARFVGNRYIEKRRGNTRILFVLHDKRIERGELYRTRAVRVVERYVRNGKFARKHTFPEMRKSFHGSVRKSVSEIFAGLPGKIFIYVAANNSRVFEFSVLFRFHREMRIPVYGALVGNIFYLPIDKPSVSGKPYRSRSYSSERKRYFVCLTTSKYSAFHFTS